MHWDPLEQKKGNIDSCHALDCSVSLDLLQYANRMLGSGSWDKSAVAMGAVFLVCNCVWVGDLWHPHQQAKVSQQNI